MRNRWIVLAFLFGIGLFALASRHGKQMAGTDPNLIVAKRSGGATPAGLAMIPRSAPAGEEPLLARDSSEKIELGNGPSGEVVHIAPRESRKEKAGRPKSGARYTKESGSPDSSRERQLLVAAPGVGVDTRAPQVSCTVTTERLWPADRKFKDVGLSVVVQDDLDPAPSVVIEVFSDEAEKRKSGDSVPIPDALPGHAFGVSQLPLQLRADRDGGGDGRVYLIVARARDASGNLGFATCTVVVPHSAAPAALSDVQAQAALARAQAGPYGSSATPFPTGQSQNRAPVASGDSYSSTGPLFVAAPGVLTNDLDPELDVLNAVLVTGPARGSLTLNGDGSFQYFPTAGFVGVDTFTYKSSDGALESAPVVVTLTLSAPIVNHAPVVAAGADQMIILPVTAALSGSIADDGLPAGNPLSVSWSRLSGPGTVTFSSPDAASTTASFSEAGIYVLRLTGSDGELTTTDEVSIDVLPQNQPPVVLAGPDQTITLPASATLNGSVVDDGLPGGSQLVVAWSVASGPGAVAFGNPGSPVSFAAFSEPGIYILRLTGNDSEFVVSDDVVVVVHPTAVNLPPLVNAGPDQTVDYLDVVQLNGTVTDDGLPAGASLVISWSVLSSPGTVVFGNPAAATTSASFGSPGNYLLLLRASDGEVVSQDLLVITVEPLVFSSRTFVQVSAGGGVSLALDSKGLVWTWGGGPLGDSEHPDYWVGYSSPILVPGLSDVKAIEAAGARRVVLDSQGRVWWWGISRENGGWDPISLLPVQVSNLPAIRAIAVGEFHNLALDESGRVWEWGRSSLYKEPGVNYDTPSQVQGLPPVMAISAGGDGSMAVDTDGNVWTWGSAMYDRLGGGIEHQVTMWYSYTGFLVRRGSTPLSGIAKVSAGYGHDTALSSDGQVWTWGSNLKGELGIGSSISSTHVPQLLTMTTITSLSAGYFFTLAVDANHALWAWGMGGNLGDGVATNRATPVLISTLPAVQAISAGSIHSLALDLNGKIWAWGSNSGGVLGRDLSLPKSLVPLMVP